MSMIGKSLVHYEITSEIGRGGMGEVYQAKDTKLGRDVAIKVLPEEFARDTDRVARFQREAKLLASLNHPNIAAIYGLEEAEGMHFLVMELIEGDTLRDRIKSGPIPVEEALKLALQMAEALEAAHENGVIHRDLKPANIKVTPDGKVKILDFGLAKAYVGDQENLSPMDSPTISAAATQQGVILGTAAYMSPEQARGKPIDKRADIWAFGCVLYEMLTGKAAFQGEDVSETLASVIKGDSNLGLLPANIHPRVREVITRCLQKEQKKRYGGIGEAQYEIEQVLADPSGVFMQPGVLMKSKKKLRVGIPWVAAAIAITALVIGVAVWYLKPLEPKRVIRFSHDLPVDQKFKRDILGRPETITISPKGSHFVYCTTEGLYLRSVDELGARYIPGTDGNSALPFFSPDGNSLGFFAGEEGKLKKVSIGGGAPVTICDAQSVIETSWNEDDTIIYGTFDQGIMQVSADGGIPNTLIEAEDITYCPQILPNGKSILYCRYQNAVNMILVHSFESGETRELLEGELFHYLPTGHLVYELDNNLLAVPFDPDTLELGGQRSIIEDVGPYSISDEGTLVYIPGRTGMAGPDTILVWIDREGTEELIEAIPHKYYSGPRISPDGTKVVLTINNEGSDDIYVWDLILENLIPVSLDDAVENNPLWTPDGQRIVFYSSRGTKETGSLYWKASDGRGDVQNIESMKEMDPVSWSGDGKILIVERGGGQNRDIGMISIEEEHKWTSLLQEEYTEEQADISPDGQWMAYVSSVSGQKEIYVRPFPEVSSKRWKISNNGGLSPQWSPHSRELFYISGDSMMAVKVKSKPTFEHEKPSPLFKVGAYMVNPSLRNLHPWDVDPDGKRFLMVKPVETVGEGSATAEPSKIIVVINWFEELKQRVPVD